MPQWVEELPGSHHGAPNTVGGSFQEGPALTERAPGGPGPIGYTDTVVKSFTCTLSFNPHKNPLRCGHHHYPHLQKRKLRQVTQPGSRRAGIWTEVHFQSTGSLLKYVNRWKKSSVGSPGWHAKPWLQVSFWQDYARVRRTQLFPIFTGPGTHQRSLNSQDSWLMFRRAHFGKCRLIIPRESAQPF